MKKRSQRSRSIIDHTTTCTHCGHRVLPENLEAHIRRIHPGLADDEEVLKKIRIPRPRSCPYCRETIDIHLLEGHIRENHPVEAERAADRVKERAKREAAEKRRKRRLADLSQQYQMVSAEEADRQEMALPKAEPEIRGAGWATCPECSAQVREANLEHHRLKLHSSPLSRNKSTPPQPQRGVYEIVYCPVCDRPVPGSILSQHIQSHQQ